MPDTHVTEKTRFSHDFEQNGNFIPTSAENPINRPTLGHETVPTYGRLKKYGLSASDPHKALTVPSNSYN